MDTFKVIEKHLAGNKAVYCVEQALKIIAAMNEMTPDEQSQSFLNKLTVFNDMLFRVEGSFSSEKDKKLVLIPNTSWVAIDVRDLKPNDISVFPQYSMLAESLHKRDIECTPETRLGMSMWESSFDGYYKNAIHCESPGYFTDDCLDEVQRFLDQWRGINTCRLLLPYKDSNRNVFYVLDYSEDEFCTVYNGDYLVLDLLNSESIERWQTFTPEQFNKRCILYPAEPVHNLSNSIPIADTAIPQNKAG
jgi:hypothetical protein